MSSILHLLTVSSSVWLILHAVLWCDAILLPKLERKMVRTYGVVVVTLVVVWVMSEFLLLQHFGLLESEDVLG